MEVLRVWALTEYVSQTPSSFMSVISPVSPFTPQVVLPSAACFAWKRRKIKITFPLGFLGISDIRKRKQVVVAVERNNSVFVSWVKYLTLTGEFASNIHETEKRTPQIGHFRVHLSLHFKARLSAKSLLWKSVFIHIEIGTNYHNKNFALRLALKERLKGTRKWPIMKMRKSKADQTVEKIYIILSNIAKVTAFFIGVFSTNLIFE